MTVLKDLSKCKLDLIGVKEEIWGRGGMNLLVNILFSKEMGTRIMN
jgi:hypothetical protein